MDSASDSSIGLDRRRCFLDPAQCPCPSGTRGFSRRSTVLRIFSRSSQPLCSNSLVCAQFPSGIWPGSLVDLLRFDRVYRAQWGGLVGINSTALLDCGASKGRVSSRRTFFKLIRVT
ncbi:hypothetical protein pipiens_017054 [Culex pipiens pipiens]|uniref:Uncharacterized protein n=1 Tax=Culex pipiens pipiens TaxID=38569 RepID=A0ABD1CIC8_CULPP